MATLDDAKLQLNIPASDTTHDVELSTYVEAANLAVERHTGLTVAPRTISGERHHRRTCALWLNHKPVQSVTSVARVDGSLTWDVADLDVDGEAGLVRVVAGPAFSGLFEVTYEAGYAVEPDHLNLASRIIVQHMWQTQRGAMGSRRVTPAMNDSMQNLSNFGRGYAIPNAALELLGEPIPVVA